MSNATATESRLSTAVRNAARTLTKAGEGLQDEPNLRTLILWSIGDTAAEHALAIASLTGRSFVRSSKILLRTIIEGWIVARYLTQNDDDDGARAYVLKHLEGTSKLFQRLEALIVRFPERESWILSSAGLTSKEDLHDRQRVQDEEIADLRERLVSKSFPSTLQCARALGVETEVTYAAVYGYLLSDQVHVGAGDALHNRLGLPGDAETVDRVLISTLALLLDLAQAISDLSGRPDKRQIKRMKNNLQEFGRKS